MCLRGKCLWKKSRDAFNGDHQNNRGEVLSQARVVLSFMAILKLVGGLQECSKAPGMLGEQSSGISVREFQVSLKGEDIYVYEHPM